MKKLLVILVLVVLGSCVPSGDPAHAADGKPYCRAGLVFDARVKGCRRATWQDEVYRRVLGPALEPRDACRTKVIVNGVAYCYAK